MPVGVVASTAIGVLTPERSGMASGVNNTFRQVGIAAPHAAPAGQKAAGRAR